MKYWKKLLAASLLSLPLGVAHALDNEFSLGMAAPDPTGLSIKKWVDSVTAYDMFYEWSTRDHRATVHIDLLNHDFEAVQAEGGAAPVYWGMGVRVRYERGHNPQYGFRIPLGIAYMLEHKPLEFFGELGPRVGLYPETNFSADIMVGLRYRI